MPSFSYLLIQVDNKRLEILWCSAVFLGLEVFRGEVVAVCVLGVVFHVVDF